jgi:hypothetical protein
MYTILKPTPFKLLTPILDIPPSKRGKKQPEAFGSYI